MLRRVVRVALLLVLFAIPALCAQAQDPAALAKADEFFAARDWARAAEAYAAITKAEPKNGRAWFQLGSAYHELGKYREAITAFEQAGAAGFGPPGLLMFRRVRAYAKMGDKEGAFAQLKAGVDSGFSNLQALDTHPDLAALREDPRFAEIRATAERNARPCDFDARYRQFDFWIGEWDVAPTAGPANPPVGASSIQRILSGCIIFENWTGANGYSGKSFNLFNSATNKWEQIWVDSVGGMVKFEGEFQDGVLHYYAENPGPNNTRVRRHLQFIPQGPDQVRQFSQQSSDNGKTWTVEYDLTYRRKK